MKWGKLIKKIHFWDLPAESAVKGVDEMNRTVRDIVNDGGNITDVSVEESDLEEIFFGLVGIEE
jgi:hypothetical protein